MFHYRTCACLQPVAADEAPGPRTVRWSDLPMNAVYSNFNVNGPLQFVQRAAGVSEQMMDESKTWKRFHK